MSEDLIKIRNQIMDLAEEYFILKEKDKIFIENISSIPVSGKVLDNKDLINLIQFLSYLCYYYKKLVKIMSNIRDNP